jgi:hypothetical protein
MLDRCNEVEMGWDGMGEEAYLERPSSQREPELAADSYDQDLELLLLLESSESQ